MDDYDGYLSVGNSGFTNGVQVIVIDQLYPVLTGRDTYAELLPLLTEGADRKAFDQVLEKFCQEIPGTMSVSYEQTDQQLEESFAQIHLLAWGLILFVGLIGVLNIINTVYTNIHTRKKEIGTQRAIGMSLKSLYKTFLWEGAYYGLLAAVIGGMAGSFCAMVIQGAQTGTVTLGTPPWLPLFGSSGRLCGGLPAGHGDSPAPNCTFVYCRRHRNGRIEKKKRSAAVKCCGSFSFVYSGIIRRAAASRREKETVQNPQAELANAAMGLELFRRVFSRQPHCGGTGQCSLQWRSDSEKSCHDSAPAYILCPSPEPSGGPRFPHRRRRPHR